MENLYFRLQKRLPRERVEELKLKKKEVALIFMWPIVAYRKILSIEPSIIALKKVPISFHVAHRLTK